MLPFDDAAAAERSAQPQNVAQPFGRYVLRYLLADGGMASVYLGEQPLASGVRKWVALKLVHPHIARDERFVRMFLDEARIAARLDHPHVCRVTDFGEVEGSYFLAMEYLHGQTLAALIRAARRHGPIPLAVMARIVADVARGLHHAHQLADERGQPLELVHRDVSPHNAFVLYDGVAKIMDFGVARTNDRLGEPTIAGELRGRLAYMAPEQIRQLPLDRRCDVFALGVVLWEATLGRRLFRRDGDVATMRAVLDGEVPAPRSVRADYPAALEAIVMRALAHAPDARFATAGAMADALEDFLAQAGPAGATTREVRTAMHALFAEAMERREALLRAPPPTTARVTPKPATPTLASASAPARRWTLVAAGAVLAAASGVAVTVAVARGRAGQPTAAAAAELVARTAARVAPPPAPPREPPEVAAGTTHAGDPEGTTHPSDGQPPATALVASGSASGGARQSAPASARSGTRRGRVHHAGGGQQAGSSAPGGLPNGMLDRYEYPR